MTLKLLLALNKLWIAISTLNNTEALKSMGWKTITGAVLMGLGYAAKALASTVPALDVVGDALIAIGVALGGIGVRAAIAKSK
jgi:hypothetical protein